ncbi:DUF4091 domain-containing protein [Paenibacillus sp.]|uniref:DUF4091 domain-containing protein n=1 Tax=Paenibacillus sp. TaxID=58172 RepID=UPI002D5C91D6|nr:DUF4091 domain-containing protein [Paenibacillus sp.]HZG55039.1 DUF4091 domain-containing protein [Paenibacillus sp.]
MPVMGLKDAYFKYVWHHNAWDEIARAAERRRIEVVCGRRDSAAFQAVVGDAEAPFSLTVGGDPYFYKGGRRKIARLEVAPESPGLRCEVALIGFADDDEGRKTADPILEAQAVDVEQRRLQSVWIEFHADASTPPGVYRGTVRLYVRELFEDETLASECDYEVRVVARTLPEPRDYRFDLNLWQHQSNLARKYGVPYWSEAHFALIEAYMEPLSRLGQKTVTTIVSEAPWSGQNSHRDREPSDLFEYNMVRVVRRADGAFHYDYSALDRIVELADARGMARYIDVFGLLSIWQDPAAGYGSVAEGDPDGLRVRYYDEGARVYRFMRELSQLDDYIRALERHFASRGWTDRVRIVADEPDDVERFERRMARLRRLAPSLKLSVCINHLTFLEHRFEGITDYVPYLGCAAEKYDRLQEIRAETPGRFQFYVCCQPRRPNSFLVSEPLESRALPWLVDRLGLDGLLRWSVYAWPDRPNEKVSYRPSEWMAGDTLLVYPGASGRPMPSLRLKWLERGIRDYEWMRLLRDEGYGDEVDAAMREVFAFEHPRELAPLLAGGPARPPCALRTEAYDRLFDIGLGAAEEEAAR